MDLYLPFCSEYLFCRRMTQLQDSTSLVQCAVDLSTTPLIHFEKSSGRDTGLCIWNLHGQLNSCSSVFSRPLQASHYAVQFLERPSEGGSKRGLWVLEKKISSRGSWWANSVKQQTPQHTCQSNCTVQPESDFSWTKLLSLALCWPGPAVFSTGRGSLPYLTLSS